MRLKILLCLRMFSLLIADKELNKNSLLWQLYCVLNSKSRLREKNVNFSKQFTSVCVQVQLRMYTYQTASQLT